MTKALVYHRKNYLFGVARPGALVSDGETLACLDNALAPVFRAPLAAVTVKKGFGIFSVFVDGSRVAYLTPVGGDTSPAPSAELLVFLRSAGSDSTVEGAASVASGIGEVVGGAAGSALSVGADVVGTAAAVAGYVSGMKELGAYLDALGVRR